MNLFYSEYIIPFSTTKTATLSKRRTADLSTGIRKEQACDRTPGSYKVPWIFFELLLLYILLLFFIFIPVQLSSNI